MKGYTIRNQTAYSAIAPFYKAGENWYEKDGKSIDDFLRTVMSNGKVLSIGSGTGHMEGYIQQKGFQVTGIDIAEQMVAIASKNSPRCKFIVMDGEKLDFEDESFDAVVSRYASQHLNFQRFISEIARTLKENGSAWLMTHMSLNNMPETLEFSWNEVADKAVMMLPTKRDILDEIEKYPDLCVQMVIEYPERSRKMSDMLILFKKRRLQ